MTTESSQPAQPAPEAPQSAPAASSSSGNQNQQLRIAVLVVIAAIVGVGLWLALRNDSNKHKTGKGNGNGVVLLKHGIGPVLQTQTQLGIRPLTLAQPIYWAGPKKGYNYEFWRLRNRNIAVRYLPKGTKAGADGKNYLIVETYPFPDAYNRLKRGSKNKGVAGQDGSYIWQRPNYPQSVLMAWPKIPFEVEVYHPNPARAATIAESGQVQPVAG